MSTQPPAPHHQPATTGPPSPVPRWYAPASAALVIAIGLLVGLRGYHHTVLAWGRPFWDVTYGSGFIRRGLVGTIFQAVFGSASYATQTGLVIAITVTVAIGLLCGLAMWVAILVARASSRGNAVRLVLLSLPIVASSLFSMLIFTTGYLDGLLLAITAVAAVLLARGWLWPAVAVACVAPFVHELSAYLWVPVAVFGYSAISRRVPPRRQWETVIALCLPLVVAIAITRVGSRTAVQHQITAHVQGTPGFKATLFHWEFGQTFPSALHHMDQLQRLYWWPTEPAALVYFCWPALLAITVYLVWRWRLLDRAARVALILAIAAPWSALILAWDLSRLILLANAMSLIVILSIETTLDTRHSAPPSRAIDVVLGGATVLAMSLPFMYVYFDLGFYVHHGPMQWSLWPVLHPALANLFRLR